MHYFSSTLIKGYLQHYRTEIAEIMAKSNISLVMIDNKNKYQVEIRQLENKYDGNLTQNKQTGIMLKMQKNLIRMNELEKARKSMKDDPRILQQIKEINQLEIEIEKIKCQNERVADLLMIANWNAKK